MLFNQAAGFLFLTPGKVTIKVIPIGVKRSTIKIGKIPSFYYPSLKTISACNLLQASWFIIILTSNSGRNTSGTSRCSLLSDSLVVLANLDNKSSTISSSNKSDFEKIFLKVGSIVGAKC